jgi:hypothetical protein
MAKSWVPEYRVGQRVLWRHRHLPEVYEIVVTIADSRLPGTIDSQPLWAYQGKVVRGFRADGSSRTRFRRGQTLPMLAWEMTPIFRTPNDIEDYLAT